MTDKMRERVRELASETVKHFFVIGDGADKLAPWIEGQIITFLDSLEREQGSPTEIIPGLRDMKPEEAANLKGYSQKNIYHQCSNRNGAGVLCSLEFGHTCDHHFKQVEREQGTASEARQPDGYAWRYHDCIRFTNGESVNGGYPLGSIPYYFGTPLATTEPEPEYREHAFGLATHREQAGEREECHPAACRDEELWRSEIEKLKGAHAVEITKICEEMASRHEAELVEAMRMAAGLKIKARNEHDSVEVAMVPGWIQEAILRITPADIRQRVADSAAAHDLKVKQDFAERLLEAISGCGALDGPKMKRMVQDRIRQLASSEYTDFDGTCVVSEGVKGAYVPRSPKPISESGIEEIQVISQAEYEGLGFGCPFNPDKKREGVMR